MADSTGTAVSAGSLQQQLETSLRGIGYSGKVGRLPLEVTRNERLVCFLEWMVGPGVLQPSNCLSASELEKFEEVKSSGDILEGQELQKALARLGHTEEETTETIRREIADLKTIISPLKTQLQSLNGIQKKLNDHYSTLVHKQDELSRQRSGCQQNYKRALEGAEEDNTRVNRALEELMSATQEVAAFHREEATPTDTPHFLSAVSQESYHVAEGQFLAELTAFTKKQFFQGIATMAHSPDSSAYGVVDLSDTECVLLRGVSQEEHQKHCQELQRLQSLYPLTEVQRINAVTAEHHALAASRRAEEEVTALSQHRETQLNHHSLRQQIRMKQGRVSELRSQIQEVGLSQLPSLLQDMAALEVSRILHGDYDLKMARQDYFTSKQDKVISHLQSQRARHELLSMLYELELRRHRETHRLLSTASSQLEQWKEEGEKRIEAMQCLSVLPVKSVRQTIDSRDKFAQRLCSLLGVQPSSAAPLLTHASLVAAVEQLSHQLATLEAILSSYSSEQMDLIREIESLTADFERQVFGHTVDATGKPQVTLKEFKVEVSKLQSVLGTLEQNIKSMLKDYETKKKALQSSPLMEMERKLFVYFFTNPSKLSQVVAELARRVDALAAAQQTQ